MRKYWSLCKVKKIDYIPTIKYSISIPSNDRFMEQMRPTLKSEYKWPISVLFCCLIKQNLINLDLVFLIETAMIV